MSDSMLRTTILPKCCPHLSALIKHFLTFRVVSIFCGNSSHPLPERQVLCRK